MIRLATLAVTCSALLAACSPANDSGEDAAQETPLVTADQSSSPGGLVVPVPDVPIARAPSLRGPTSSSANPDATTPDEAEIARALLADPSAYPPITYVYVTKYLWARGDRRQAAFWHTLFQIRTAPYLRYDRDLGPLRGSINQVLGGEVLRWIGSDYAAWEEVTRQAMAYERRAPLNPERPEGVAKREWLAHVAQSRQAWATDFNDTFGPRGPGRRALDSRRRSNGLYVGPLQDPGAALPAEWR